MDATVLRRHASNLLTVLFALLISTGIAKATVLAATPSTTVNLTCNTQTGPGTATTLTVKYSGTIGTNSVVVSTTAAPAGVVITTPTAHTLTSTTNTAGLAFTVGTAAGCAGLNSGTNNLSFNFTANSNNAGAQNDILITVVVIVTASQSALVATPNPVALSCVYDGTNYYPGPAVTVSITSAATGGTPFTVTTTGVSSWATVGSASGNTAGSTAVTLTVTPTAGCGGLTSYGTTTSTNPIQLVSAPAPAKTITVTITILHQSPLTATPSPASLTYVKGSGSTGKVSVNITGTGSPAPFFSVNTATLPIWLTVDSISGTVPKTLQFSNTTVADTMAPGTYTASVHLLVSGYGDLTLPVSMLLTNAAPKLSVVEGTTRDLTWTIGQALPTPVITASSTDTPIAFTITTGGSLAPIIPASELSGLAYSFGTPINVSFNPVIFASAQPGNVLTGTVTLTWGSPVSTIVVTFNITVLSPGATITGLSPSTLPTTTVAGTQFTVVVTGTGFVVSTDPTQKTKIGIVGVNNALTADTNISSTVVNPSNMILTITVPATTDANLPFATGGNVPLGVCNPVNGTCTTATGTAPQPLAIGSNPIIQSVTSASSLIEVSGPTQPTIAPYDMLSIFGSNFCAPCASNQVLYATPDPVLLSYPAFLTPDSTSPTRNITVTFQTHGTSTVLATAPLLFATNSQINVIVPGGLSAEIGSTVDVVVNFGYGSGATFKSSAAYPVSVVATNPGVFTIGADGQGPGAVLNSNWQLISSTVPAGMRSTSTDSDVVQIYLTGLGVPDSTGDNSSSGSSAWSTDCVSTASFLTWFNSSTGNSLTSLDGTLIIPSVLNTGRLVPCIKSNSADVPTVTVGGQPATVAYAGWVPGDVAGLYQINATLPSTIATVANSGNFTTSTGANVTQITAPVQLPIVVTANSRSSQAGVTLWVAPRLLVSGPINNALSATVGQTFSNTSIGASEGTSPYRYAVTSGLLPSGLAIDPTTGAISGTPAANTGGTYSITVTATDSANVPLTGSVSFTLTVAGGLFMSKSGSSPYSATFGTADSAFTTIVATGGVYPYTYAITQPTSLPAGLTINSSSGAISTTALTPAGNYSIIVTATDSTTGTPLTGTITLTLDVALDVSKTTLGSPTGGNAGAITTVSATGYTTSVSYALDSTTAGLGWVTINSGTGAVAVTSSSVTGNYPVTVTATSGAAPTDHATAGTGTIQFTMVIQ